MNICLKSLIISFLIAACGVKSPDARGLKSDPSGQKNHDQTSDSLAGTALSGTPIVAPPANKYGNYIDKITRYDRDPMVPLDSKAATHCEILVRESQVPLCGDAPVGFSRSTDAQANLDAAACAAQAKKVFQKCFPFIPEITGEFTSGNSYAVAPVSASFYKGSKLLSHTAFPLPEDHGAIYPVTCRIRLNDCPAHPEAQGEIDEPYSRWYRDFQEPFHTGPAFFAESPPYVSDSRDSVQFTRPVFGRGIDACKERASHYQEWCKSEQPVSVNLFDTYSFNNLRRLRLVLWYDPTKRAGLMNEDAFLADQAGIPVPANRSGCSKLNDSYFTSKDGGCAVTWSGAQAAKNLVIGPTKVEYTLDPLMTIASSQMLYLQPTIENLAAQVLNVAATYEQAVSYCDSLVSNGFDDWRLPTSSEIRDLKNIPDASSYFPSALAPSQHFWVGDKGVVTRSCNYPRNAQGGYMETHSTTTAVPLVATSKCEILDNLIPSQTTFVPPFPELRCSMDSTPPGNSCNTTMGEIQAICLAGKRVANMGQNASVMCVRKGSSTPGVQTADIKVKIESADPTELFSSDLPDNDAGGPFSFGLVKQGQTVQKTFTIENTGKSDLLLSNMIVPRRFTLIKNFGATTVKPGDKTSFTLQMDGTLPAGRSRDFPGGMLSFTTNVPSKNPYNFLVFGRVVDPLASTTGSPAAFFQYGNKEIKAGDTVDLGYVQPNQARAWNITIGNRSIVPLNYNPYAKPPLVVESNGNIFNGVFDYFNTLTQNGVSKKTTITLNTPNEGEMNGTVRIYLQDLNANPFVFHVKATSLKDPPVSAQFLINNAESNVTVEKKSDISFSWSSDFASSCQISPAPTKKDTWTGLKGTVSAVDVGGKVGTTLYTLKCVSPSGSQVSIQRTVSVTK